MITTAHFGTLPDGREVTAYTLKAASGLRTTVLDYGAILHAVHLPDGRNVIIGRDTLSGYLDGTEYRGAFICRNANRIVGAAFEIDGTRYTVPANEGANNLHSGPDGLNRQLWQAEVGGEDLILRHDCPDGHQGFPGAASFGLTISLSDDTLRVDIAAEVDAPGPINPTWHPYWNLLGKGRIDGHDLRIASDHRTVLNRADPLPVENTRFDFRRSLPLGSLRLDENYVAVDSAQISARGITLTVESSLPDMQVYTGDGMAVPREGLAIEPQFRPDDVNRAKDSVLRPGERFAHWITYRIES